MFKLKHIILLSWLALAPVNVSHLVQNSAASDRDGKIAYIWNPALAKKLIARKEIKL